MKRSLSLLIAAALVLALCAGCAKKEEDGGTETTGYTARELAAALIASQSDPPEFYYVTESDSVFSAYAALYLGADLAARVKSGAICYPVGVYASEAAVFEMDSPEAAREAPEHLEAYIENRVAAFYGYAPEESELAGNGQARTVGSFAVLYILADTRAAGRALDGAFSPNAPEPPDLSDYAAPLHELEEPDDEPEDPDEPDEPGPTAPDTAPPETAAPPEMTPPPETVPPEDTTPLDTIPPETAPVDTSPEDTVPQDTVPQDTAPPPTVPPDTVPPDTVPEDTAPPDTAPEPTEPPAGPDEYDHDLVLAALRGESDPASLQPKNLAVYDAVNDILAQIVTPGMTDYEKELAVNDYLVFHAEYDPAELSSGPVGTPDPDNDNPYGLLVKGVGICLGYATTFQLFMDVLDIRCLTVHGFAHGWTEDHAWNLVCLEGDWYAVDVTWNDPVFTGGRPTQSYRLTCARQYFNVTSDYLRDTQHYWREDVPEAEGTKYAYN